MLLNLWLNNLLASLEGTLNSISTNTSIQLNVLIQKIFYDIHNSVEKPVENQFFFGLNIPFPLNPNLGKGRVGLILSHPPS